MLGGLVVAGGNRGAGWETGAEGAPGPSRRPHFVPSCPLPPGGAGSGLRPPGVGVRLGECPGLGGMFGVVLVCVCPFLG